MVKLNVRIFKKWRDKSKGLIGITNIYPVYFETRFGIHTFGMKVPIDVLILDNKNRVVLIRKNLRPRNVFFWNPIYSKVIELPSGKYKIALNEIVNYH